MAQKTAKPLILRRLYMILKLLCAGIVALVGAFLATAWIGSSIPRNSDWVEPDDGITIMIESNDVHTAIVMPIISPSKDWREDFPLTDIERPDWPYTHISVSWGQKDAFLNTPTWADLTAKTALRAVIGGEALLHIAYYANPQPSAKHRALRITPSQYAKLISVIERNLTPPDQRKAYPGYSWYDTFYDAPGAYHLGMTCNQWTSDTLAEAGIKTGLWTPFAGGVMKWVSQPDPD